MDVQSAAGHVEVRGDRLTLRPATFGFTGPELQRRYQWSLDNELQYWSGTIPGGRSYGDFAQNVAHRDWPSDGRRISYAILTNDGDLIGMVSCYNIDRMFVSDRLVGELGVYLGEKRYWGSGYGTDAVTMFLRHLFENLEFDTVYLHTYKSNIRARRSYARVGFEVDEERRRYSPRVGYHEELRMSITRSRFNQLHGLEVATT